MMMMVMMMIVVMMMMMMIVVMVIIVTMMMMMIMMYYTWYIMMPWSGWWQRDLGRWTITGSRFTSTAMFATKGDHHHHQSTVNTIIVSRKSIIFNISIVIITNKPRYDLIIKMETFSRDSFYISKKLGLDFEVKIPVFWFQWKEVKF